MSDLRADQIGSVTNELFDEPPAVVTFADDNDQRALQYVRIDLVRALFKVAAENQAAAKLMMLIEQEAGRSA